jgi:hypothetical protein
MSDKDLQSDTTRCRKISTDEYHGQLYTDSMAKFI